MSLTTQIGNFAVRVGTEFKAVRTDYNGKIGTLASLSTTDKTNLVAAINEIFAGGGSGGVATLDDLTDVVITTPATGHVLRHNGTNWVNALGTTFFDAAGAAASAQAASQPLDADLTTISGQTNTAYGLALLTLANQAGLMALLSAASATAQGIVELATDAEAVTGTDTARATTPANVAAVFADRIDTNTALGTSNVKMPSQNAVKTYTDALLAANDALRFRGGIDASTNPNYPAASAGDMYKITVAGKIGGASGINVEVGDTIIDTVDGSAAGTQAAVGANWIILQTNIDGAVVGPASSTSGDFATFSGTGGKTIQDSGISLDTGTSLGTSNTKIPSQNAVKVYADTKQPLDTDLTAIAALTSAADQLPYATGVGTWSLTTLTAAARTLLDDVDVAAMRTTLSVFSQAEIGDVNADFVATFEAALV